MKNFLLILAIIASSSFAQTTKKVAFLGNSYTYFNDLPGLVQSLATADGNALIKDQSTPGGYTLNLHSTNTTSLSAISSDTWDYVVLQDQSQLPSFPWGQVQAELHPYAEILVDSIRSANDCAVPLFFNTWGRLVGDPQWDSINTFDKMNMRLYNSYRWLAEEHSGKIAPVGIGFNHIHDDGAPVVTHANLYSGDGSHPSLFGSYLAACIFYETIFEESCQGNSYIPAGITASEANYLQDAAHHVVNDVDSLELDYTNPLADFTFAQASMDVVFTNTSEHSFLWTWDFGDGNSSTDKNPTHTYGSIGIFDVVLTAEYCGNMHDTTFQVAFFSGTAELENQLSIYPNPSSNRIMISSSQIGMTAEAYTLEGRSVGTFLTNDWIETDLSPGVYIVKVAEVSKHLIIQ